jgi:hypothetical protein
MRIKVVRGHNQTYSCMSIRLLRRQLRSDNFVEHCIIMSLRCMLGTGNSLNRLDWTQVGTNDPCGGVLLGLLAGQQCRLSDCNAYQILLPRSPSQSQCQEPTDFPSR